MWYKSFWMRRRRSSLNSNPPVIEVLEDRTLFSLIAGRNFDAGSGPRSVAVGDFDGNGDLDLVVANYLSANVSVLLSNGDGTFRPARNFAAGYIPQSVAVGD